MNAMRVFLKLIGYLALVAALGWLVPRIATGFQRATDAGNTPEATRAWFFFTAYLLTGAVLAVIVAWDVSRFFGSHAARLFWGGGRVAGITSAWWKAERMCRDQQPREAIRVLRDHLASHPKHWAASVRIAEIYERELNDALSAALEYEALLQRKLPKSARAEVLLRLAACHLLRHQPDDCATCLQQVIVEFPGTDAAQKAGRRLARLGASPPAAT
jgi:hypothetical protein